MHVHPDGQFTFVTRGVVSLHTPSRVWIVPRGRLAWIPPQQAHASRSQGAAEGWLVLAPPNYAERLPSEVCILQASSLLIAALERIGAARDAGGALERLLDALVLAEVGTTSAEDFSVPMPRADKLRGWAMTFLQAPHSKTSIEDAAAAVGMSRRSFTRHVEAQTGTTFAAWKRCMLVNRAIEKLAAGQSVGAVAFDLGYESTSAFIAMFKAARGLPPRRYMQAGGPGD